MFKKYFQIILSIITLLLSYTNGDSQQLQFEQFTTANGLPSDRVYSLRMDTKGYIWACTNYGLAKFNGQVFSPVCRNIPFKEFFAYTLTESDKEEMWFASPRANIYKIKNDSAFLIAEFEKIKERQKNAPDINNMFIDDAENIFISTTNNSYKLTCKDDYNVSSLNDYYNKDSVDFILIKKAKQFLVIKKYTDWPKEHTIFTYKIIDGNTISKKQSVEIKNKSVIRLAEQYGNSTLLTAANELIKINADGSSKHLTFLHTILCLSYDKYGNIWVGLDQEGLYKINPEVEITEHYFPTTSINNVLFDDQLGLWVSTAGQGIYHCCNISNYSYSNHPELSQPTMIRKIDTTIFIGTPSNLFKINKKGDVSLIDLKEQAKSIIVDMKATKDGFYISSKNTIIKTDFDFKKIECVTNEAGQNVSSIGVEHNDNGDWFSLSRTTIFKIKDGKAKQSAILPSRGVLFINYKDNCFMVGATSGLYLFTNDTIIAPSYLKQFEDIYISHLIKSKNGDLWISTVGHGLYKMKPDNEVISYPEMPGDVLHDVFFLNDTTIGLCLNTGVFITPISKLNNPKDWHQIHNEESATPLLVNHRLYISTNSELLSFDLNGIQESSKAKLYFKKAIAGDSTFLSLPLQFQYDQNRIEFSFDLLDYSTTKARIFFQLDGETNESGIIEGTKLSLGKLQPGRYILTVKSAISPFHLKEKGLTLCFVIAPAFWQTSWFLSLIIIISISIIIVVVYLLNRRTKNKERQKTEITRLLAEYKLTALKAQINPHFISNSLSAIQQLILDDKSDKASQYIAKFSLLIRYVLKYSDKSIVKLSEELEVIDLNLELETLRFKDDFEIEKTISSEINIQEIGVPPLITQPFIENAIWHGLLPLKGKRKPKLSISVSKINSDILIRIEDNGVGRTTKKEIQRESKGTQLISNRLENINLSLGTKTAMLEIQDIKNDIGEPIGTRVSIIIPSQLNTTEYDED